MGYYHKATQKDLEELLLDIYQYMSEQSDIDDADSSSGMIHPNKEKDLQARTKFVLGTYLNVNPETGEKFDMSKYPKTFPSNDEDNMMDSGDDPMDNMADSDEDEMVNESIQKIRAQFKRFL